MELLRHLPKAAILLRRWAKATSLRCRWRLLLRRLSKAAALWRLLLRWRPKPAILRRWAEATSLRSSLLRRLLLRHRRQLLEGFRPFRHRRQLSLLRRLLRRTKRLSLALLRHRRHRPALLGSLAEWLLLPLLPLVGRRALTKWLRWRLALRGRLALTKGLLALLGRLTEWLLLPAGRAAAAAPLAAEARIVVTPRGGAAPPSACW